MNAITRFLTGFALIAALGLMAGCSNDVTEPVVRRPVQSNTPPPPAVPIDQVTFAFDPFIGAPGNIADDLSRKIGALAKSQNLTIIRRSDRKVTYRVKGYLSAVGDNTGTVIVYVYDIFDAANRRVYRLTGQETSSGSSGDPWSGITGGTLQNVAVRTIDGLKSWLTRAGG